MSRALLRILPLAALALSLFLRNRGGWADPLVDFGRELYLPWQIGEGTVLYRDVVYLDGPFSPYWNALWMRVGGVSLATLEWVNLGVIALTTALFHALLSRLGGSLVAFAGAAVFLSVFAFNLIASGGNMNWVAPYSHSITHGTALAVLALWFWGRYLERRRTGELAGVGFALGMAFLTKPEVAAAAGLAVVVGVGFELATRPAGDRHAARTLAWLAASAAIPVLVAAGALASTMPLADAAAGALGGWAHLARSDVGDLAFYRWVMGVDHPGENLTLMVERASTWAIALVPTFAVALALKHPGTKRNIVSAIVASTLVAVAASRWASVEDWGDFLRPVTAFVAAFLTWAAVAAARARDTEDRGRAILQLSFSVLALALLLKILLQPALWGYGFALAAPAMMVVVLTLVHWIPAFIERRGGFAWLFRGVALALLALVALGCLEQSEELRRNRVIEIGRGGDRMIADGTRRQSKLVKGLVSWVRRNLPADSSLLVMPEGVTVNYLTRRVNPTPHLNFVPPEVEIFGEAAMLSDLRAARPDFVALVHRDTSEYFLPLFGIDYGRRLHDWVHDDYELVARVGAAPLRPSRLEDDRTGFEIWKRRGR